MTVLDRVKDLLAPLMTAFPDKAANNHHSGGPSVKSSQPATPTSASVRSKNQYDLLDRDVAGEDMPDIQLPEPSQHDGTQSQDDFSVEATQEEAAVQALAFFVDVHTLRDYIKGLWADYKSVKVNLVTASVTTNIAIQLLQKPHDQFVKEVLPLFGDNDRKNTTAADRIAHMQYILWGRLAEGGQGDQSTTSPAFQGVDSMDKSKLADFLMSDILEPICIRLVTEQGIPGIAPRAGKQYFDQSTRVTLKNGAQEFTVFEAIFELAVLIPGDRHRTTPLFGNSHSIKNCQTIRALGDCCDTGQLYLLAMIAVRILLDIHLVLGTDTTVGCRRDMLDRLHKLDASLDAFNA